MKENILKQIKNEKVLKEIIILAKERDIDIERITKGQLVNLLNVLRIKIKEIQYYI